MSVSPPFGACCLYQRSHTCAILVSTKLSILSKVRHYVDVKKWEWKRGGEKRHQGLAGICSILCRMPSRTIDEAVGHVGLRAVRDWRNASQAGLQTY